MLTCAWRLLDVIAGRKNPRGLRSGQVLVDNKVVTSELQLMSAYVVQVSMPSSVDIAEKNDNICKREMCR